jgi:hypothetical protein
MAKQSHNLQVRIGSVSAKPARTINIATGAPSSGNVDRTNVNHNPKPGSAAVGPRQDGNQGSSLQGSKPGKPNLGPNAVNLNGTRTPRGTRPA